MSTTDPIEAAPAAAPGDPALCCPLCGSDRFRDEGRLPAWICEGCGSRPRMRACKLMIDALSPLRPGMRILHFAPEARLAAEMIAVAGSGYEPCDLKPSNYPVGVPVRRFDLCRDTFELPEDAYDLVVHNHVVEHIPCNYTVVLQRLQRSVKPGGFQMFTVPFSEVAYYREALTPHMTRKERHQRFGRFDHYRVFGRKTFAATIGMIFGLDEGYTMADYVPPEALARAAIRPETWGPSGSCVFAIRRGTAGDGPPPPAGHALPRPRWAGLRRLVGR